MCAVSFCCYKSVTIDAAAEWGYSHTFLLFSPFEKIYKVGSIGGVTILYTRGKSVEPLPNLTQVKKSLTYKNVSISKALQRRF
jgi:hypothetical protein